MQFKEMYTVKTRELGKTNEITNYGILALLEDIAGMHSDSIGYGVKDIERNKRSWIIMNWKLKVFKRPGYGERLLVKTWTRTMGKGKNGYFSYRDFEIIDNEGNQVAIATSKWILYDIEKQRISKISSEIVELYKTEQNHIFEDEEFEKLQEPQKYETVTEYVVKRSDIDVNQHVHNLNYLNIAYEALPEEIYEASECMNVLIEYKHQIKFGAKVKCHYTKEDGKHIVTIKSDDDSVVHAIIELF